MGKQSRHLTAATRGIRSTQPTTLGAALVSLSPGRARHVLDFWELAEEAGGTVWDLELRYGVVMGGLEVEGGESHELWPRLEAMLAEADDVCEACGEQGAFRGELRWFRVLCDSHHEALRREESWPQIYSPWWPRVLAERPDLWPPYASEEPRASPETIARIGRVVARAREVLGCGNAHRWLRRDLMALDGYAVDLARTEDGARQVEDVLERSPEAEPPDRKVDRMQTPEHRRAVESLFRASGREIGEAAIEDEVDRDEP